VATTFKFDKGPSPSWAKQFFQAPLAYYENHPSARFRVKFGPVYYRGRLNGKARLLIVGQDPSTDEIIAQRNFVGSSGQRVQRLLNKLGMTRSYVMLNTFLFGIKGQMDAQMRAIALEAAILDYRNALLDKVMAGNPIQAIISFGNGADFAVNNWPGRPASIPWFRLTHPSNPSNSVPADWNENLNGLRAALKPDKLSIVNLTPYGASFGPNDVADIPPGDLPFAIAAWHGTGGATRSQRNGENIITWTSPL
jgi:uracil-DNA glycosylase